MNQMVYDLKKLLDINFVFSKSLLNKLIMEVFRMKYGMNLLLWSDDIQDEMMPVLEKIKEMHKDMEEKMQSFKGHYGHGKGHGHGHKGDCPQK